MKRRSAWPPRRVDVLSQLGEQSRAIQCFHDALIIDPNRPIVRFNLGLAYMRAGRFEPARTELTKVVKAQPGNLTARNLLGLCLLKLGRLKEGVTELKVFGTHMPKTRCGQHLGFRLHQAQPAGQSRTYGP